MHRNSATLSLSRVTRGAYGYTFPGQNTIRTTKSDKKKRYPARFSDKVGDNPCESCPEGSVSTEDGTGCSCDPGSYFLPSGVCQACPTGTSTSRKHLRSAAEGASVIFLRDQDARGSEIET